VLAAQYSPPIITALLKGHPKLLPFVCAVKGPKHLAYLSRMSTLMDKRTF